MPFTATLNTIREARRRQLPLVIRGRGSTAGWLPDPPGPWAELPLSDLAGPVEVNPENLSASFLAGTPVSAVDAALAEHGLMWPLDADRGRSLGGVLAAGADYPGRTGYGPIRDWVLGLQVGTSDGQVLQLGGSTMKNVAGYDLVKLHLGARGTLGPLLSATLRLLPRPLRQQWFTATPAFAPELRSLVQAAELSAGRLYIRLDGRSEQIEHRAEAARHWLPDLTPAAAPPTPPSPPGPLRLRLAVPAARAAEAQAACVTAGAAAVAGPVLLGLLTAWFAADTVTLPELRQTIDSLGGQAWIQAAPAEVLANFPARLPTRQDGWADRLRTALAPGRCFNPHL